MPIIKYFPFFINFNSEPHILHIGLIFNSNENSILYINEYSYYGNVDKVLLPGSYKVKDEVLVGSLVGTTYSISSTESRSLTPNPDDGTERGGGGGSSSDTSQNTRASLEAMYFSSIRDYMDEDIQKLIQMNSIRVLMPNIFSIVKNKKIEF